MPSVDECTGGERAERGGVTRCDLILIALLFSVENLRARKIKLFGLIARKRNEFEDGSLLAVVSDLGNLIRRRDRVVTDQHFSDDDLDKLRFSQKRVTNPSARWVDKPSHRQRNYDAETGDGVRFRLYQRQDILDKKDFSCGLALIREGEKPLSLVRYNGSSHRHGDIRYRCHIHRATAEAIAAGKRVDSYAEETDRYQDLRGAFVCLIEDCGVKGISAQQGELFNGA